MEKITETENNKIQSAVVIALVIGLLAGFFIGRSWGQKDEEVEDKTKTENVENVSGTTDSLEVKEVSEETVKKEEVSASGDITGSVTVSDQKAGSIVVVSNVNLSADGWVAVREDTGSGMGKILGAQWLPSGTKADVSIELLRATEANKNYFVTLYDDNGDKKFDKMTDLPIAVDGKAVSGVFSAK